MTDIFVSYAHEDAARVQPLVHVLESQGWTVFWDRRIPTGKTWRSHIGQALADAKCVIVAWSAASVVSDWVAEEADDAKTRGILVPVLLDEVPPPIGFRGIQAANLAGWREGQASPRLDQFIADIRATLKTPPSEPRPQPIPEAPPAKPAHEHVKRPLWIGAAATAAALLAGGTLYFGAGREPSSPASGDPAAEGSPSTAPNLIPRDGETDSKPAGLFGTTQPAVILVQEALRARGYDRVLTDGTYGAATRAAVRDFQAKHGLEPTGELDGATAQAIVKSDNK
jgi:hypothetical protein